MKIDFMDQAIPDLEGHHWDVVQNVAINDCGEALIDIPNEGRLKQHPIYYENKVPHAINQCLARESVVEKLYDAIAFLPEHLGIVVLDAWRPRAVQKALLEQIGAEIKKTHHDLDADEYAAMLSKFVAPADARFISPHLTGGSVDITLFERATGSYLDMGSVFDEPSEASYTNAFENRLDHSAHGHRRLLYGAMIKAGFTNITSEWWHYDFGNQLWAHYRHKDYAIYGEAKRVEHI